MKESEAVKSQTQKVNFETYKDLERSAREAHVVDQKATHSYAPLFSWAKGVSRLVMLSRLIIQFSFSVSDSFFLFLKEVYNECISFNSTLSNV